MKRLLACAAWGAVALLPVAAGAVPTTVITQTAAPVQIKSCSATVALSVPGWSNNGASYGQSGSGVAGMSTNGHSVSYGSGDYSDHEGYLLGPFSGGTDVYATAQSENQSQKIVTGVVYEFNVLKAGSSDPLAIFYGGETGSFGENVVISPASRENPSWSTSLGETRVGSIACFIAYVRFSDGSDWTSPLAVVTK